jgi:hypothetical protein
MPKTALHGGDFGVPAILMPVIEQAAEARG